MRQKGHNVEMIDAVSQAIDKKSAWPAAKDITKVGLDIDEIVNKIPVSSDVIGITCMFTPIWPHVRKLVKAVKDHFPKTPLVMGGENITGAWQTVLATSPVDFCVLGEGEATFEELVNTMGNGGDFSRIRGIAYRDEGRPVINEPRPRIMDIDSIPLPAWDLIDMEKYIDKRLFMGASKGRTIPIIATRGCPHQCRFCTACNMWKKAWVPRKAERVIDEIELYMNKYNADDFQLMDLTAITRKDWTMQFAGEILRRKIKINWQLPVGTRTAIIDREITDLLVESGCRDITFAPESGSQKTLEMMGKKVDIRQLENSIKAALASRMTTCLFFLIGFPGEDRQDIKKTFKLIRRMAFIGVHEIAISTFIPIPGTDIFDELRKEYPERFKLTDEFCYMLFSSLSLNKTNSWNSNFSDRKLSNLRMRGLIMFYAISYAIRPWRLVRLLVNLFTGKQEMKVDRVLRELLWKK